LIAFSTGLGKNGASFSGAYRDSCFRSAATDRINFRH
jgi:hypothetical protein